MKLAASLSGVLSPTATRRNRTRPVSVSSASVREIGRRFDDGSSGLLPDLCSRGVRASRSLRYGAGGFLPGASAWGNITSEAPARAVLKAYSEFRFLEPRPSGGANQQEGPGPREAR